MERRGAERVNWLERRVVYPIVDYFAGSEKAQDVAVRLMGVGLVVGGVINAEMAFESSGRICNGLSLLAFGSGLLAFVRGARNYDE